MQLCFLLYTLIQILPLLLTVSFVAKGVEIS